MNYTYLNNKYLILGKISILREVDANAADPSMESMSGTMIEGEEIMNLFLCFVGLSI